MGGRVADASLRARDRKAAVQRFRLLHLLSLLVLLSLVAWTILAISLWRWWPIDLPAVAVTSLLFVVCVVGVLAIATARYRVLPGRRWLRLVENGGILLICIGLASYAVVGIRTADNPAMVWRYASGAALALALGFFLLSRAPARAALVLARQLASHGSQPRFEGTLKRLLRRHRPILVASAVAVLMAIVFSGKATTPGANDGQRAETPAAHQAAMS